MGRIGGIISFHPSELKKGKFGSPYSMVIFSVEAAGETSEIDQVTLELKKRAKQTTSVYIARTAVT